MVEKIRIYQLAILGLVLLVIILVALVAHFSLEYSSAMEEDLVDETSQEYAIDKYDGFFRTKKEQEDFEIRFKKRHSTLDDVGPCENANPLRTMGVNVVCCHSDIFLFTVPFPRSEPLTKSLMTYHSCCESSVGWISPDTAIDVDNQNVTLVQSEKKRQYFQTESCCQVDPCSDKCTCQQGKYEVTALVDNPKNGPDDQTFAVKQIVIPGCCKCVNNNSK